MISRRIFSGLFLAFAFLPSAESAELSFHSYSDAIEIAKSKDKMIYVLFGSEHCPWCHKQKDVLAKNDVIEALSEHVICYVDVSIEKNIADRYRVRAIPVSIILDSGERVVQKNVGYMEESRFLNWLR